MGICWPGCAKKRLSRRIVLLLIGLDNAGKTQTVNTLSGVEERIMPTVGFKAVNLVHRSTPVTIYDLGGGVHFRDIWPQYYSEVHGVVFVIDASDNERMEECGAVLTDVISHERIAGKPILILANKQDKTGALDDIDIVERLGVERLVNRYRCPTLVESYTATAQQKKKIDPGLKKGYTWLLNYIARRYGDINLRVQTDIHAESERRRAARCADELGTGFENPHYVTLDRDVSVESEKERIKSLEDGVIIVKPIHREPIDNSKSTTLYSDDDIPKTTSSEYTSRDSDFEKVVRNFESPVADRFDSTVVIESKDRIESKNNVTVVIESKETLESNDRQESKDTKEFKHRQESKDSQEFRKVRKSSDRQESKDTHEDKTTRVVESMDRSKVMREKVPSAVERTCNNIDIRSRPQSSPTARAKRPKTHDTRERLEMITVDKTPSTPVGEERRRPTSASQLVRRQLELPPGQRRLSLKHPLRNRTAPMPVPLFHYEPGKEGEGDFKTTPRPRANQRDWVM